MIIFLLILSIIFNIAAFLSIYLLFMRQNRLISKEVQHEKALAEIEQTFTGYLLEMKDENEAFLKQFEKISRQSAMNETKTSESSEARETTEPVMTVKTKRNFAAAAYKKPEAKKPETVNERARAMVDQGYTIEQVAKELKKGKTEVELMLKFGQS